MTPPNCIDELVPVVLSSTDPAVRIALPTLTSMPCTAVALMAPPPRNPVGEPMREPAAAPVRRRKLPPTFSVMSVGTPLVVAPELPMATPDVDTAPPCRSRSAPVVIVSEVPAAGVAPPGPPILASPLPPELPPTTWALPVTWMTCDGAMTVAELSVPPAPAKRERVPKARFCNPPAFTVTEAALPAPPRPPVTRRLAACTVWFPRKVPILAVLPSVVRVPALPPDSPPVRVIEPAPVMFCAPLLSA